MPPTPARDWHRTDSRDSLPCGCELARYIEIGTRDYHEAWGVEVRCAEHALQPPQTCCICYRPTRDYVSRSDDIDAGRPGYGGAW
jgi:hypothetical protein